MSSIVSLPNEKGDIAAAFVELFDLPGFDVVQVGRDDLRVALNEAAEAFFRPTPTADSLASHCFKLCSEFRLFNELQKVFFILLNDISQVSVYADLERVSERRCFETSPGIRSANVHVALLKTDIDDASSCRFCLFGTKQI